jgi:anti-sigma-K factor RskA
VSDDASSFDQRLTDLQSQLERLSVTLQDWREQQDHLKPAENRLAELTRQCGDIVHQWSATSHRQERAVQQLEERVSAFSSAEERLHKDSAHRLQSLERVIEQEWSGLRQLHQAPARELREQAVALGELSVAAANSSTAGLERAEARLADIERTLHYHLSGVSQRLDQAVAEIRTASLQPAVRAPETPAVPTDASHQQSPTWPIEGVVRLHNQLRESAESPRTLAAKSTSFALPSHEPEIEYRLESLEQAIADRTAELRDATDRGRVTSRLTKFGLVASAAILALAVGAGITLRREARDAAARAAEAQAQAQVAVNNANQQVSALKEEAARQAAAAREDVARAQAVSDVLAAPDIIRYSVSGGGPNAVSGQVLWSRTRGVVFSGVRLPAAPPNMTYQLWLLTDGTPVSAGTFAPDESGRITFSAPAPNVPRPVVGAALTVEPAGGSPVPSDPSLLHNRPASRNP